MLLRNEHLNHRALMEVTREQYGDKGTSLDFLPLGEDSWSYRFGSLWVSVRRDLRGHVPAAYRAAHELREAGLEFVLAPIAGADGEIVRTVDGFPVVVFPYVCATPVAHGPVITSDEQDTIIRMIREVQESVITEDLPEESYQLSFADQLANALTASRSPDPDIGPFAPRLHHLIARYEPIIISMQTEIERLSALCGAVDDLVLTHGEPSTANVLRHGSGLLLADWGGTMWGPPERDWFHIRRTLGAPPSCRNDFLRFYELRWILSEITEYSSRFVHQHRGDAEDHAMWERLLRYLPDSE